jgi:hypothetical protein
MDGGPVAGRHVRSQAASGEGARQALQNEDRADPVQQRRQRRWPAPGSSAAYGESGIPVSELFPHVARHADELAVIRSMTSKFSEHTNANYFLHTGTGMQGRPSMGAWFGYGLGSECRDLPGFVVLNGGLIPPGGLDNFNSGFLPATYQGSIFKADDPPVANIRRRSRPTRCSGTSSPCWPARRRRLDRPGARRRARVGHRQLRTGLTACRPPCPT